MRDLIRQSQNLRFTIQESFIALLPYFVLSSTLGLANSLLETYGLTIPLLPAGTLADAANVLHQVFPLVLALSFSFHLAMLYQEDRILGTGLATIVFIFDTYSTDQGSMIDFPGYGSLTALVAPFLTLTVLRAVGGLRMKALSGLALSRNLANALSLLVPYLVAFVVAVTLLALLRQASGVVLGVIDPVFTGIPDELGLALYVAANQLLWFIGLHGNNILNLVVAPDFLAGEVIPNLAGWTMIDLFVAMGGSGATIGLALAVLLVARDPHTLMIGWVALPFCVFNISEVLVFGLPVVFNLRLLLPFVAIPLINLTISLTALSSGWLAMRAIDVTWSTPILLNAAMKADDLAGPLLQLGLIGLSTLIYLPFVRQLGQTGTARALQERLRETTDLDEGMTLGQGRSYSDLQTSLLRSHVEARNAIELMRKNELVVHYQPIVAAKSPHRLVGFEALLRVRDKMGGVTGPFFLAALEDAGLASVIDRWVCSRVGKDLAALDLPPGCLVRINLHPDSLAEAQLADWLAETLPPQRIAFELIERGVRMTARLAPSLTRLRQAGFGLAMDDFGDGYSNLSGLLDRTVDVIKIDRSLLLKADTPEGSRLYRRLVGLCHDLGYRVIAEGVETAAQLALVQSAGVDAVQGWHFAPALAPEAARAFSARHAGGTLDSGTA